MVCSSSSLVIPDFLLSFLCRPCIYNVEKTELNHRRGVEGSPIHSGVSLMHTRKNKQHCLREGHQSEGCRARTFFPDSLAEVRGVQRVQLDQQIGQTRIGWVDLSDPFHGVGDYPGRRWVAPSLLGEAGIPLETGRT